MISFHMIIVRFELKVRNNHLSLADPHFRCPSLLSIAMGRVVFEP